MSNAVDYLCSLYPEMHDVLQDQLPQYLMPSLEVVTRKKKRLCFDIDAFRNMSARRTLSYLKLFASMKKFSKMEDIYHEERRRRLTEQNTKKLSLALKESISSPTH